MRTVYSPSFKVPEWHGTAVLVGELWKLTKGSRVAVCTLSNHPIGAEIRCDVDGDLRQSQAGRDGLALLDLANEWKRQFQKKGWKANENDQF